MLSIFGGHGVCSQGRGEHLLIRLCAVVVMVLGSLWVGIAPVRAECCAVIDDSGRWVRLSEPAKRVVSLAPHLTESLYAIGAGDVIVGRDAASDYPESALSLPIMGRLPHLDREAVLAQQPDLLLVWQSGAPDAALDWLHQSGIPVYRSEPQDIEMIASTLERLGTLTGHEAKAHGLAEQLSQRWEMLGERYGSKRPLSVFVQVWAQPLITLGGGQAMTRALNQCGGVNLFADQSTLAPRVSLESVLAREPEVILGSADQRVSLQKWRQWPQLPAIRSGNLMLLPKDLLSRMGPRFIEGAGRLCRQLDQARQRLF
ncbi:cobalamin-binding protein [Terasakiispira papahanaumokuakeensis]|nr:cobalamin-binding protein [Terasakiispira papahanaumokuakeensis]